MAQLSEIQKKRVLVTGGVGFIGTHLCRKLVSLGHDVTSLDLREPTLPVDRVRYVRGDILDRGKVDALVAQTDVVCHLAAIVSIPLCQADPFKSYETNFLGTLNLLESIRGVSGDGTRIGLLFASTAAVYGTRGDHGQALGEDQVSEAFLSYYAAQKHASEQAIRLHHRFHGIPATVFRFFNVYGQGQDPESPYSGVITIYLNRARQGLPLVCFGGGAATRDFVSVHDIVSGCVLALDRPLDEWDARPTNLGTGSRVTVRELAEMIAEEFGGGIPVESGPPRDGDVLHSLASIDRARATLGFAPSRRLAEGLKELRSSL